MENITIRQATKTDIPIILGLLYDLGRPKPKDDAQEEIFEKKIKLYLNDSDKAILIAEQGTEIMGLVSIIFLDRLNQ